MLKGRTALLWLGNAPGWAPADTWCPVVSAVCTLGLPICRQKYSVTAPFLCARGASLNALRTQSALCDSEVLGALLCCGSCRLRPSVSRALSESEQPQLLSQGPARLALD